MDVKGNDAEALLDTICKLHQLTQETRNRIGTRTDVILAGDLNRHGQLWGGNGASLARQGEDDPIIDFMSDHSLTSLLPRGTKTWQSGNRETTIDLILASEEYDLLACHLLYTHELPYCHPAIGPLPRLEIDCTATRLHAITLTTLLTTIQISILISPNDSQQWIFHTDPNSGKIRLF